MAAFVAVALLVSACASNPVIEQIGAEVTPVASNDGAVLVKPPDLLEGGSPEQSNAEDQAESSDRIVEDVEFTWFDGSPGSLVDLRGQPVVLNFWASNCPPCVAEMPDFEAVHQDLGDRIEFVGMNVADGHEAALALAERTGVTYRLASDPDSEVFRSFHGFVMPTTILIDQDGTVAYAWAGVLTESELRSLIDQNLAAGGAGDSQEGSP